MLSYRQQNTSTQQIASRTPQRNKPSEKHLNATKSTPHADIAPNKNQ